MRYIASLLDPYNEIEVINAVDITSMIFELHIFAVQFPCMVENLGLH